MLILFRFPRYSRLEGGTGRQNHGLMLGAGHLLRTKSYIFRWYVGCRTRYQTNFFWKGFDPRNGVRRISRKLSATQRNFWRQRRCCQFGDQQAGTNKFIEKHRSCYLQPHWRDWKPATEGTCFVNTFKCFILLIFSLNRTCPKKFSWCRSKWDCRFKGKRCRKFPAFTAAKCSRWLIWRTTRLLIAWFRIRKSPRKITEHAQKPKAIRA